MRLLIEGSCDCEMNDKRIASSKEGTTRGGGSYAAPRCASVCHHYATLARFTSGGARHASGIRFYLAHDKGVEQEGQHE